MRGGGPAGAWCMPLVCRCGVPAAPRTCSAASLGTGWPSVASAARSSLASMTPSPGGRGASGGGGERGWAAGFEAAALSWSDATQAASAPAKQADSLLRSKTRKARRHCASSSPVSGMAAGGGWVAVAAAERRDGAAVGCRCACKPGAEARASRGGGQQGVGGAAAAATAGGSRWGQTGGGRRGSQAQLGLGEAMGGLAVAGKTGGDGQGAHNAWDTRSTACWFPASSHACFPLFGPRFEPHRHHGSCAAPRQRHRR